MSESTTGAWSYRPGDWFAVFGSSVTILLPESEKGRVLDLWALVDGGDGFDDVLDGLLATGLSRLPGFVLVSTDDGPTRILLRGDGVVADVRTAGEDLVLDGAAGHTWVEKTLPDVEQISIRLPRTDADDDVVGSADFPILTGLVRIGGVARPPAVAVAAAPAASEVMDDAAAPMVPVVDEVMAEEAPAEAPVEEVMVEDVMAEAPAEDAGEEAADEAPMAPTPALTFDEGDTIPPAMPLDAPMGSPLDDPLADPIDADEADTMAEPAAAAPDPLTDELDDVLAASDDAMAGGVDDAMAPEGPSTELLEDVVPTADPLADPLADPISDVLPPAPAAPAPDDWVTPWDTPGAPPIAPPPIAPPIAPPPAAPPAEEAASGADVVPEVAPPSWAPPPPPVGSTPVDMPPPPLGIGAWEPVGRPTPAEGEAAPFDPDHDGSTMSGATPAAPPLPGIPGQPTPPAVTNPVATLLISDGQKVVVDRAVLIGRAPEARRFTSTEQPMLVTVPSRLHEISSTHIEVRPGSGADHGSAVVTDMGSTNGTVLVQPGLGPEDLKPGIAVQLIPGAIINLGDGITIQVTHA